MPEICSLDCGSLNFGDGSLVYVSTPDMLRRGAKRIRGAGRKAGTGNFRYGQSQFCPANAQGRSAGGPAAFSTLPRHSLGRPGGRGRFQSLVDQLPLDANWTAFALGRYQMAFAAQAVILGGNVRVGLEDNLYLDKGVFASNAQLVERARKIVEMMGARVLGPAETREKFGLVKRA